MWKILKILKMTVIGAAFVAAFGFITMHLWNALIPDLFHGPLVNFWQAVGLVVLSHILFRGGFKHGGWHHRNWQHKMHKKMEGMTPEEREKFLEKWGSWGNCCPWHAREDGIHAGSQPGASMHHGHHKHEESPGKA